MYAGSFDGTRDRDSGDRLDWLKEQDENLDLDFQFGYKKTLYWLQQKTDGRSFKWPVIVY